MYSMSKTCKANSTPCTTQCKVRLAPNHALHVTIVVENTGTEIPHILGLIIIKNSHRICNSGKPYLRAHLPNDNRTLTRELTTWRRAGDDVGEKDDGLERQ